MYTKAQFVDALKSKLPDVFATKANAEKAFDAFCEVLGESIVHDGVRLPNIGGFSIVERKAREGRNPQTGEKIAIPARKVVKFSPSKSLSDQVNN